jgi:hypothetical protein
MSSSPVVPSLLKRDLSWITHHLILVSVLIAVLFVGVYEIENLMEKHDKAREAASAQTLQLIVEQVKMLETHMATNDAAAAQREAQYNATIQALTTAMAARDKQLQQQIQKNATLTAQQAAARLAEQYKVDSAEVQAQNNTVVADLPVARQFVTTFDQNVACQLNLTDTRSQLGAEQGKNKDLAQKVSDRDGVIAGKNDELGKQKKDYENQITVLKDDARKGKLKWFGIGFVTGYIAGRVQRAFGF